MNEIIQPYILRDLSDAASHFACSRCKTMFAKTIENNHYENRHFICARCGFAQYSWRADLIMDNNYRHIDENVQAVKDMSWYHISELDEPCMEFESENTMHIGQLESLRDLIRQRTAWNTGWEPFCVYELRIRQDADIYHTITADVNDWRNEEDDIFYGLADGFVYVNRYEAPGSVSLIIKRNCVELVRAWDDNEFPSEQ